MNHAEDEALQLIRVRPAGPGAREQSRCSHWFNISSRTADALQHNEKQAAAHSHLVTALDGDQERRRLHTPPWWTFSGGHVAASDSNTGQ